MAKKSEDEKKETVNIENAKYTEFYNKAYFKLSQVKDNELDFEGVLAALVTSQENYSTRSRDIRNIFFTNSLNRANLIFHDTGLPEKINIWEYYSIITKPEESSEIFKDFEQLKKFYIYFMNRFFKHGIEEYSFFDKMVFNTLIKAKILIRYDSSYEDINITAKAFFKSVNN